PGDGDGRVVSRPIAWSRLADSTGKSVSQLLAKLARIRTDHLSLRAPHFYPSAWDEAQRTRDANGFGLDTGAQVAVYHRWATLPDGRTERSYVVLNFSDDPAGRTVPFEVAVANQSWTDLLTGEVIGSSGNDLSVSVGRCWGRVLCRVD